MVMRRIKVRVIHAAVASGWRVAGDCRFGRIRPSNGASGCYSLIRVTATAELYKKSTFTREVGLVLAEMIRVIEDVSFVPVPDERSAVDSQRFERWLPDVDARGVALARLALYFQGPAMIPDPLIAKNAKLEQRDDGDWWLTTSLLPANIASGTTYARATIHSHGPDHAETHWKLVYYIAPDSNPPTSIKNRAFHGTYPDNLLELFLGGQIQGEISMSSHADYLIVDAIIVDLWDSVRRLNRDDNGRELVAEELSWGVGNSRILTKITLSASGSDHLSWLSVRGLHRLKLSDGLREHIDDELWREVTQCLSIDRRRRT